MNARRINRFTKQAYTGSSRPQRGRNWDGVPATQVLSHFQCRQKTFLCDRPREKRDDLLLSPALSSSFAWREKIAPSRGQLVVEIYSWSGQTLRVLRKGRRVFSWTKLLACSRKIRINQADAPCPFSIICRVGFRRRTFRLCCSVRQGWPGSDHLRSRPQRLRA